MKKFHIKRNIIFCVTLIAVVCFFSDYSYSEPEQKYKIAVSQFVRHPSLDLLLRGFIAHFKENDFQIQYSVNIAKGDMTANDVIAKKISTDNSDMALSITTP